MSTFAKSAFLRWCISLLAIAGALITTAVIVHPAESQAARKGLKAITLSPARVETVAKPNLRLPVFSVKNTTGKNYKTTVFASYLLQDRAGGVMVETNPARIKRAGQLLKVETKGFNFPNGARGGTRATLLRPDVDKNFYGTVSFSSVPTAKKKNKGGASIRQALEISSSLFLRPAPKYTRVGYTSQPCFVRQLGPRKIGYFAPIKNTGNIHSRMKGSAKVTNLSTQKVVSRNNKIKRINHLPTFIVDHKAEERRVLGKGNYRIDMTVGGRGKSVESSCTMRLVGPNTLAATDAELVAFDTPKAYFDKDIDIDGRYKNTGNIAFTPRAVLQVKYGAGANKGKLYKTYKLSTSSTDPKQEADIKGKVDALPTKDNYEFTMRLLDSRGYELDSRTISINQSKSPSLWEQILDWLRAHMLIVLGALLALLLALFLFLLFKRRKRKKEEKQADISYRMERAVMQQRMAEMEARLAQEAAMRQQAGLDSPPSEPPAGYEVEDAVEDDSEGPSAQ